MKIVLGVTVLARGLLSGGLDGIGTYTKYLLKYFSHVSDLECSPVSFGYDFNSSNQRQKTIRFWRFSPIAALSAFTPLTAFNIPNKLSGIELFHSTDHHIPKLSNIPVVATIHDAIPLSNPEWLSWRYKYLISPAFKRSARWANRIITVSHFSKQHIADNFNIDDKLIDVIPNGVDEVWSRTIEPHRIFKVQKKYSIFKPYIIFVGTFQPRKNLERLINAYLALDQHLLNEFDLVLIGRNGWCSDDLVSKLTSGSLPNSIRWLQYVPAFDLELLVKGATCLAFPSLAEGFGLPVVEAFAAGIPVLTSNISSLPEISGNAALLVNPYNTDSIASGLSKMLQDEVLRSTLVERGLIRSKIYSWDKTAQETLRVYREVTK
jgi:glycosyltransferase involved in cell wall biosynthesis